MKNECLWGVDIEFKILMRKAKSLLKQTTPLQICSAPFLNSPEGLNREMNVYDLMRRRILTLIPTNRTTNLLAVEYNKIHCKRYKVTNRYQ